MNTHSATLSSLAEGDQYQLLVSGDGSAFVLRSKADFSAADLKGDDAARFRADYEALRKQYPSWEPDQTLAQLWDQGGYGWLAAQEAD